MHQHISPAPLREEPEWATLADDSVVLICAILLADAERLCRMFDRLSPTSIYRRYLAPVTRASARALLNLAGIDGEARGATVALTADEIVGVARWERLASGHEAEVAVLVEDAWQSRGLGRRLLARVAREASRRGIDALVAAVLGDNRPGIGLVHATFADPVVRLRGGEYEVRVRPDALRPSRPLAGLPEREGRR